MLILSVAASLVGVHLVPIPPTVLSRPLSHKTEQHPSPATLYLWHRSTGLRATAVLLGVLLRGRLEIPGHG